VFAGGSLDVTVGNDEDFVLLGGGVNLDTVDGVLLTGALPPTVLIPREAAGPISWLLEHLDREWNGAAPDPRIACNDLTRLIFIYVLRAYLERENAQHPDSQLTEKWSPTLAKGREVRHGLLRVSPRRWQGRDWAIAVAHGDASGSGDKDFRIRDGYGGIRNAFLAVRLRLTFLSHHVGRSVARHSVDRAKVGALLKRRAGELDDDRLVCLSAWRIRVHVVAGT
jgi:Cupin